MSSSQKEIDKHVGTRSYFGFWPATLSVFFVSVALFSCTVARFSFPGPSAMWVAEVSGLVPATSLAHPVGRMIAALFARMGSSGVAPRMNLVAAFFGAVSAAALFRLVAMLVYNFLPRELSYRFLRKVARLSGIASAVAFAFSASGWSVSSHMLPASIELALGAIFCNLALDASWSDEVGALHYVSAFCMGLFAAGSGELTVVALPAMLFLLFAAYRETSYRQRSRVGCIVAAFVGGVLVCISIASLIGHGGAAAGGSYFKSFLSQWCGDFLAEFPRSGIVQRMLLGYLPFFVILLLTYWSLCMFDGSLAWAMTLLTIAVAANFIGFPWSPWEMFGKWGDVPMPPLLFNSAAVGLLAAYWLTSRSKVFVGWNNEGLDPTAGEKAPDDEKWDDDYAGYLFMRAAMNWVLALAAVACVIFGAVRHYGSLHLRDGSFMDEIARNLVSNGALDSWPLDYSAIEPHVLLSGLDAARAEAASGDDGSIDAISLIAPALGPTRSLDDAVERRREELRGYCSRHGVELAIGLVHSGEPERAIRILESGVALDPGNISAAANLIAFSAIFPDSVVREGDARAQARRREAHIRCDEAVRRLVEENGGRLPFAKIVGKSGEIIDPDSLAGYGATWQFDHGVESSPGYDAWRTSSWKEDDFIAFLKHSGRTGFEDDKLFSNDPTVASKLKMVAYNAVKALDAFRHHDIKTALEYYRRADLSVRNVVAYSGQAQCELMLGDPVAAEGHIRELLEMDPDARCFAMNILSAALLAQGKADEAESAIREAIRRAGGMEAAGPYPRFSLARALASQGKTAEAAEVAATLFAEIETLPGEMRSEVVRLYRGK